MKYTVGIDEVGRGPLAGPVTVCAVQWLSDDNPEDLLAGIRDSKQLSPVKRQEWAARAFSLRDVLRFCVHSVSASTIDSIGISRALQRASGEVLSGMNTISHVYSDYGLPLPEHHVATHIVKGDEKHPLIALASIIAKVDRDAAMVDFADKFGAYGFERNKGYGTREHRDAVRTHGPCSIHRMSFLGNILE